MKKFNKPGKINKFHIIAAVLIIGAVLAGILLNQQPEHEKITYNEFLQAVEEGKIEKVYLNHSDQMQGEYANGKTFVTDNPRTENLKESLLVQDIIVDEMNDQIQGNQILSMIATLSLFGVLIFAVNRKGSSKPRAKRENPFSMQCCLKTSM